MKEDGAASENLLLDSADYGFDVMDGDKTIAVWLTIPFERLQELCPGTHISPELCQLAQRAIKVCLLHLFETSFQGTFSAYSMVFYNSTEPGPRRSRCTFYYPNFPRYANTI